MNKTKQFFNFSDLGGDFSRLHFACEKKSKISCLGLNEAMRSALVSEVGDHALYLTNDYVSATRVKKQLEPLFGSVTLLPPLADNLIYKRAQGVTHSRELVKAMCDIRMNKSKIIVASIDSLLMRLPRKEVVTGSVMSLKRGATFNFDEFKYALARLGYIKTEITTQEGEFSFRGDIVDIYPVNSESKIRVEFFDEVIDAIYSLDDENKKIKDLKEVIIYPNTNLLFTDSEITNLEKQINQKLEEAQSNKRSPAFINSLTDIKSRLEMGERGFNFDYCFPLLETSTIFEYLSEKTTIIIDEAKMCYDAITAASSEISLRFSNLSESGEVLNPKNSGYLSAREVIKLINNFGCVAHQKITSANRFFAPSEVLNFRTLPVSKYFHDFASLVQDVTNWRFNDFSVFLFAGSESAQRSLSERFESNNLFLDCPDSKQITSKGVFILPQFLTGGFILPDQKIVVLSTTDLFAQKRKGLQVAASRRNVFSIPKAGDYVVHSFHGIGICEGITNLSSNFGSKDFVVVRYAGGDTLYVPIDALDQLERFSGAETPTKLSKIGGVEFSHVKEKVKAQVKKIAFDLLELYAKREATQGFAFSRDSAMQREFEDSFNFIETEDQLKSIAEIKKDMEAPKVMDRLLCGDVGFGKTEVAMRAMFKAVLDNKQVAFVAPTTILSEQHYNTLKARMDAFGVRVEVLNRFKTQKEIDKVLNDLAHGRIDIVCGTHRLLSKDVTFSDLGLVVIDEEQKFGVADKEKLKNKYNGIDFLTLSATPIPRTLNMSLSGIRDVSIINTPPSERVPVVTSVCEFSEMLVRDACLRELARGGQVFILFNRVEKIYNFAERIRNIIPEARVSVAHGQLSGKELEDVIYNFYKGNSDVLVCSTIIENGIDVENANTLIVYDSDLFGLSQLYQIRGRVGRGSRTAYAYFTYNYDKILSEEAYKRLDALSEFCEFGSGFKIAMRDLEIRGGGNIFGAEQHGFMQKVGYDMFTKLLGDAVKELKGEKVKEEINTLMKISIDAFIPEDYINDSANRMTVYKNISSITSLEDKDEMISDLERTFGNVPEETINLFLIAYARLLANRLGAKEVISSPTGIKIIFDNSNKILGNEKIGEGVYAFRNMCAIDLAAQSMIKIEAAKTSRESLERLIRFLEICQKNKKD